MRKEFINFLKREKKLYCKSNLHMFKLCLLKDHDYLIWKFVKTLRKCEYYFNKHNRIMYLIYERKKNSIGSKLGITIWHNCIGEGLKIWHYGSVVVNGNAKIGNNLQLHGNNCIGNKGITNGAPILGNNVDVGFGAVIIGDIQIADDCIIGAGAVVNKSCLTRGAILAGVPAKIIGIKEGLD